MNSSVYIFAANMCKKLVFLVFSAPFLIYLGFWTGCLKRGTYWKHYILEISKNIYIFCQLLKPCMLCFPWIEFTYGCQWHQSDPLLVAMYNFWCVIWHLTFHSALTLSTLSTCPHKTTVENRPTGLPILPCVQSALILLVLRTLPAL